jgi:asparagine synthase (glutamine-hydrolysing)
MCGILGVLGGTVEERAFDLALDRLKHRGPNDRGMERFSTSRGDMVLGFRRLSILDLSRRGHQPMFDSTGQFCIVFNGEVFNFRELRGELIDKGHAFQSGTDTEVVLAAYKEWGTAAIERFVGMFAFAIWDATREQLVLARDRLGIKPLYYWNGGERFVFGSEVKALLGIPGVPRRLNREAVGRYFTFLWVPDPDTLFDDIRQLEAGHFMLVRDGRVELHQYWDVPLDGGDACSPSEAVDALEALLLSAVESRLISDVPLGAFLSGGVDSSLIVAMMRRLGVDHIITQTVEYLPDDARFDIAPNDAPYARQVRDHFGDLDYHEIALRPNVVELLPKIVWHLDDPVADPAALSTFLICRASQENATVMLSGMGAEELFGGYPRHRAVGLAERYRRVPAAVRHFVRRHAVEPLHASRPGPLMSIARNAKKFVRSADHPFEDRYLGYISYYNAEERRELLASGLDGDVYQQHRRHLSRTAGRDSVTRMTHLDLKTFLPNLNLAYTDRASMAASVEVRVPLLDHRLVELVARFPSDIKLRGRTQKYVLKRVAERYLPREIVYRPKTGFGAPIRAWLQNELKSTVRELLSPERIRARGVVEVKTVNRLLDDLWSGREDNALRVWALLVFELWGQTFLDQAGATPVTL